MSDQLDEISPEHLKRAVKLLQLRGTGDHYRRLAVERKIRELSPDLHAAAKARLGGAATAKNTHPQVQAAAPPSAPPPPARPTRYLPPTDTTSGFMPRDGVVLSDNTAELRRAILGVKWPDGIPVDWPGHTTIANLAAPTFWNSGNLSNATAGGVHIELPAADLGKWQPYILHSSIDITAKVTNFSFQAADGSSSVSDTGGSTLSSGGTYGTTNSLGVKGTAAKDGVGGEASASTQTAIGQSSGSTMSGTSGTSTAPQEDLRFSCDIEWQVSVHQNLETGTFFSITSMGADNLAAWIMEHPTQEATAHSTGVIVRFPTSRCVPET